MQYNEEKYSPLRLQRLHALFGFIYRVPNYSDTRDQLSPARSIIWLRALTLIGEKAQRETRRERGKEYR